MALLEEHRGEALLYAGGTEVLLLLKERLVRVESLIDLKRVPGLDTLAVEDGGVSIGATVRHRALEQSTELRARCPILAGVARHVANVRVRSIGTVGGNLAFADPHSDLTTLFLALDGRVTLAGPRGEREVALGEFVLGPYETVRADDEVLTRITLSPWPAGTGGAYLKFGVRERPTLGVAVALTSSPGHGGVAAARLAAGCVVARPRRLPEVEAQAIGWSLAEVAARADDLARTAAAAVDPTDDLHGSAEYKREITRVFVRRAIEVAAARAGGVEPHVRYPYAVVI